MPIPSNYFCSPSYVLQVLLLLYNSGYISAFYVSNFFINVFIQGGVMSGGETFFGGRFDKARTSEEYLKTFGQFFTEPEQFQQTILRPIDGFITAWCYVLAAEKRERRKRAATVAFYLAGSLYIALTSDAKGNAGYAAVINDFIDKMKKTNGGWAINGMPENRLLLPLGDSPFATRRELKIAQFGREFNAKCDFIIRNMFENRKYKFVPLTPVPIDKGIKLIKPNSYLLSKPVFIIFGGLVIGSCISIAFLLAILFQNSLRERHCKENILVCDKDIIIDTEIIKYNLGVKITSDHFRFSDSRLKRYKFTVNKTNKLRML